MDSGPTYQWPGNADEEDRDIAKAITASLFYQGWRIDKSKPIPIPCPGTGIHRKPSSPLSYAQKKTETETDTSEDSQDMPTRLAVEMILLCSEGGDTHVYIDAPARAPEQDSIHYQKYAARYASPLCVHKDKLIALNSPYLNKAFEYGQQYRVLRRRGLVGKLPSGIKYVLDLTPPNEGDDAVYLTTELCCSEGVRLWSKAGSRWHISKTLIGGLEQYPTPPSTSSNNIPSSQDANSSQAMVVAKTKREEIPLEYSSVRHRCAIERVLRAIEGLDPQLDSACKVSSIHIDIRLIMLIH